MSLGSRWNSLLMLMALGLSTVLAQPLSKSERLKLHPTFHAVVSNVFPHAGLQKSITDREPAGTASDGAPLYDVIIYTTSPEAVRSMGVHVNSMVDNFVTAQITPADMLNLVKLPQVFYLDPGSINYPLLDFSVPETGSNLLHSGFLNNTPYKGKGVIVLVYDTGIDWRHFDFRDPKDTTKTRILFLWDQTITASPGENPPSGFSYGVEYTKAQIEAEFGPSPPNFVRERDINGHGTHVASTAAGNGLSLGVKYPGMAPEADLIIIKGGDGSFSESKMIDGLTYANSKASSLGKPIVINWSIGGQIGPHDGSRPYETAVNSFVTSPGRVVTISAGNDGASPIHISGNIGGGTSKDITITVPSYAPSTGSGNDQFYLDLWFDGNPALRADLKSPTGVTVTKNDNDPGTVTNDAEGKIYLWNQTGYTGEKNLFLYVRDADAAKPPKSGSWILTVTNLGGGSARYDGWLALWKVGTSNVIVDGGNTTMTVAMPATSTGAITVASYVTKWSWPAADGNSYTYDNSTNRTQDISTFSSIGPTRDGRQKPDIAAPGQGIVAALSSSSNVSSTRIAPGGKHYLIQGTSMAAPHVAGAAALLLQGNSNLTSTEIKNLLRETTNKDSFTGSTPNYVWGYGKMDVLRAMVQALFPGGTASRSVLAYAGSARFFIPLPTTNQKLAVRFTPLSNGRLTASAVQFNGGVNGVKGNGQLIVSAAQNVPGSVAGIPGPQIGANISVPFSALVAGAWNNIDLMGANISVTGGTDYHIVFEVNGGVGDTLQFLLDDGLTSPTNRSSSYRTGVNGLGWYNRADANYAAGHTPSSENLLVAVTVATISSVQRISEQIPVSFNLYQNYPNPFNPSTTIRYSLPTASKVKLVIFDVMGREIATLINEEQSAGVYQATWNATTSRGGPVSSGVYFYRLEAGGYSQVQKMIVLR